MALKNRGRELLLEPLTHKGSGFTRAKRDELGLHGLLPQNIFTLEEQLARAYENNRTRASQPAKCVHLATLQDRSEVLFFRRLHEHIEERMPIVYTPTVGEAGRGMRSSGSDTTADVPSRQRRRSAKTTRSASSSASLSA